MSEPFLGEIRIMGFNFAPRGWTQCDGQILPINQNQSLYSLLGTIYGGDGRTSFALPDLRGRTPIHMGSSGSANHPQGQKSGEEVHTLSVAEMASHTHTVHGSTSSPNQFRPKSVFYATSTAGDPHYSNQTPNADSSSSSLSAGGGQAHENMQPYTTLNFCIALQGLFPSRN